MTVFHFIRHGETEWNVARRIQGQTDSPLTPLGQAQCEALAERVAQSKDKPDVLVASDLGRTQASMGFVADKLSLPVTLEEKFREIHFGIWEGELWDEMKVREPGLIGKWRSFDLDAKIPEGESRREVFERVQTATINLAATHPDSHVMIVTHGGVIQILMRWILGLPIDTQFRFFPHNTCVNTAEYTAGEWRSVCWGDVAHLQVFSP